MDLTSLACFVAAAQTRAFRVAAARVALSPAAFSERIRALEEELAAPLFARTTRRVDLTEAGRRLLPEAQALLEHAARLPQVVRDAGSSLPYELTVGTRYELGVSWLVPAVSTLEQLLPERTLHLVMSDGPDLLVRLERGDLDAVVSSARLTAAKVAYAALHEETYVLVGPDDRFHGPESARDRLLLDLGPDLPLFRYLLDAEPRAQPWPFAGYRFLGSLSGIRHRLLEGAGVAVLPRYFIQADLDAGRLIALLPHHPVRSDTFRLVWRRNHPREAALLTLADQLRALPLQ